MDISNITYQYGTVSKVSKTKRLNNNSKMFVCYLVNYKNYKVENKDFSKASYHRLSFFGKNAEIAERKIKEGVKLFINGTLDYFKYEQILYSTINVNQFLVLPNGIDYEIEDNYKKQNSDNEHLINELTEMVATQEELIEEQKEIIEKFERENRILNH